MVDVMTISDEVEEGHRRPPKTLVISCRAVIQWLSTSAFYEFEDLIGNWMGAEVLAPKDTRYHLQSRLRNVLHRLPLTSYTTDFLLSPFLTSKPLEEGYDLIFVVIPDLYHTYKIWDFRDLHKSCVKLACYIPETWSTILKRKSYLVEPLRHCDQLFVSTLNSIELLEEMIGVPCQFLPFGVDAVKFSPFPFWPERHIDVLSIGRRSPITHEALLDAVAEKDFFYVYDTIAGFQCKNARDHRTLLANMAKRSKYFISNVAEFNRRDKTGGAVEIGHRFYEGAAAGAVLLGHYPVDHPAIRSDFDWPDAIIQTEIDAADIVGTIKALNAQPERLRNARLRNVRNCMLRHDVVYRWEQVLSVLGFAPSDRMKAREAQLRRLADAVEERMDASAAGASPNADMF